MKDDSTRETNPGARLPIVRKTTLAIAVKPRGDGLESSIAGTLHDRMGFDQHYPVSNQQTVAWDEGRMDGCGGTR